MSAGKYHVGLQTPSTKASRVVFRSPIASEAGSPMLGGVWSRSQESPKSSARDFGSLWSAEAETSPSFAESQVAGQQVLLSFDSGF